MLTEEIEVGKNYIIGYDLAGPDSMDYSAITMHCCNCNMIVLHRVFKGEQPAISYPKKCPNCGVRFEKTLLLKV